MLGLIHRWVYFGPQHFDRFPRLQADIAPLEARNRLKLAQYRLGRYTDSMYPGSRPADYVSRSVLGLISVYNILPVGIVAGSGTVADLQSTQQDLLKSRASRGFATW